VHSRSEFHQLIKSVTKWYDYCEFVTTTIIFQWTLDHILFLDFIFNFLVFLFLFFMFDYFWMGVCSIMAFNQLRTIVMRLYFYLRVPLVLDN